MTAPHELPQEKDCTCGCHQQEYGRCYSKPCCRPNDEPTNYNGILEKAAGFAEGADIGECGDYGMGYTAACDDIAEGIRKMKRVPSAPISDDQLSQQAQDFLWKHMVEANDFLKSQFGHGDEESEPQQPKTPEGYDSYRGDWVADGAVSAIKELLGKDNGHG